MALATIIRWAVVVTTCGCHGTTLEELGSCGPACGAGIGQTVLESGFVTPNSIEWRWQPESLDPSVNGYMLWYGEEERAVIERRSPADIWDIEDDANLGWRDSPFGPFSQLVFRTTISELSADTHYFTQLWARYPDGRSEVVAEQRATTIETPTTQLPIFDDDLPAGASIACGTLAAAYDNPANSVLQADAASGLCRTVWVETGIVGLNKDLSIPPESWQHAYVEMKLLSQNSAGEPQPVHYLEVHLLRTDGVAFHFAFPYYATAPSRRGWHLIQLPLPAFVDDEGNALTPDALGPTLDGVMIRAAWSSNAVVQIDDVALHY